MKRIFAWILIISILFPFRLTANAEDINIDNIESDVAERINNIVAFAYSNMPGDYTVGCAITIYNANSEDVYYVAPIFSENECVGTVQIDSSGNVILTDETFSFSDKNRSVI